MFCFDRCQFDDESSPTQTSIDQLKTEQIVHGTYQLWRKKYIYQQKQQIDPTSVHPLQPPPDLRILRREEHVVWLLKALKSLPPQATAYACTHPWVIYWILQSIALLDISPIPQYKIPTTSTDEITDTNESNESIEQSQSTTPTSTFWTREFGIEMIHFICKFQHPTKGGFSGVFGLEPHVLTTYAAVMSLIIVGTRCNVIDEVFKCINITNLKQFFLTMKINDPNDENYGAYTVCQDGEADTRAMFAALTVMDILGMLPDDELTSNCASWIQRCQNYDGGISSEPGVESHGGYTFTGLSALVILECCDIINLDLLEKWCVTKQLEREGGFCGRTHKLVDSCYSFWVGATISLIQIARYQVADKYNGNTIPTDYAKTGPKIITIPTQQQQCQHESQMNEQNIQENNNPQPHPSNDIITIPPTELGWLFDQQALQTYITIVCQDNVGFKDKPGKGVDFYHTCYSLSGLAASHISVSFNKASYTYINQKQPILIDNTINSILTPPKLNSPQPSQASPLLNNLQQEHSPGTHNIYSSKTSTTNMTTIDTNQINSQQESNESSSSISEPSPSPIEKLTLQQQYPFLSDHTIELIQTSEHPVVFRFGGATAKLQHNNIIYNIPQGCYLHVHLYLQHLKCERLKQ